MPELPEVEVVRSGVAPLLTGQTIVRADVRQARLRWPIPAQLSQLVMGQKVLSVQRRGKYLLLEVPTGWVIIHLGMSGVLQFVPASVALTKHDHVDFVFATGILRLNDPRRFGAVLWHPKSAGAVQDHPLLAVLGVEPFSAEFTGDVLHRAAQGKLVAVKNFLLAGKAVVGVGNIYASETLHRSGIDPRRAAGRVALQRYQLLAEQIRLTLHEAITAGGSTLRDFKQTDGASGYFQVNHQVYGRDGQACQRCAGKIQSIRQGQRSTYFCRGCQR
jgi:formamidopyrimidine-DNA glycosylase